MKAFGFAAILVSMCVMAACKVGDGTGDGGAGGEGGSDPSTSTSSSGGEDGEGGEGGGNACSALETAACAACCATANSDEADALEEFNFVYCACASDGPCNDVCDTADATDVCNDDGTVNREVNNEACQQCMLEQQNAEESACLDAADSACSQSAECSALTDCLDTCP